AAPCAQCRRTVALYTKGDSVRSRVDQLECEVCYEILRIDGGVEESSTGFATISIVQAQTRAVQSRTSIESHSGCRKSAQVVRSAAGNRLDGVDGCGRLAGSHAGGYGERLERRGFRHSYRPVVNRGIEVRSRAIGGVVNARTCGGAGDGYRPRGR